MQKFKQMRKNIMENKKGRKTKKPGENKCIEKHIIKIKQESRI